MVAFHRPPTCLDTDTRYTDWRTGTAANKLPRISYPVADHGALDLTRNANQSNSVFGKVLRRYVRVQVSHTNICVSALCIIKLDMPGPTNSCSSPVPRHVILPPDIAKHVPKNRLLHENEWRAIGVQQSRGWVHYAIHRPEPHILLFRREKSGVY